MEYAYYVYSQDYVPYPKKNVTPLSPNSPIYKRLKNLMQGEYLIKIKEMFTIDNPYIYQEYCKAYNDRKSENENIQILELFHCTNVENVPSIVATNFDWRLARRVKYGQGVSFSPCVNYANLQSCFGENIYRENGVGVIKAMFVCDVIVGHKQIGNKYIAEPDWPIDTTVSEDEKVFVKYYDHEFYPRYVIYYVSHPIVSVNGQRYLDK